MEPQSRTASSGFPGRHPDRPAPYILVAEDEPLVRLFIVDTLIRAGCAVEQTGSGADALAKYHAREGRYDAAVIDLGLPVFRGEEVVATIHAHNPAFPIVVASGYSKDGLAARLKSDPNVTIVGKPFRPAALRDALQYLGICLTCTGPD